MFYFPPTIILRHRKENLKKCSLRGLEPRQDCIFISYPTGELPDLSEYIMLKIDAPPLSLEDATKGLLLVDATWRHAGKMCEKLPEFPASQCRSIPPLYKTAYPRRQEDCPDPGRGLASVEALYIAYILTGRDPSGLLDHYYWKNDFLGCNSSLTL